MSTFRERYNKEEKWHQKVIIIELFHITMRARQKKWGLRQTAKYFELSLGLVSENLNLAKAIHADESLMNCADRLAALHKIGLKLRNNHK